MSWLFPAAESKGFPPPSSHNFTSQGATNFPSPSPNKAPPIPPSLTSVDMSAFTSMMPPNPAVGTNYQFHLPSHLQAPPSPLAGSNSVDYDLFCQMQKVFMNTQALMTRLQGLNGKNQASPAVAPPALSQTSTAPTSTASVPKHQQIPVGQQRAEGPAKPFLSPIIIPPSVARSFGYVCVLIYRTVDVFFFFFLF
jgi:hypothetical protein